MKEILLVLSASSVPVIRATLPVVAEHGDAITGAFYDSLFASRPELLDMFNRGNQANGDQRRALAAAVAAFAEHLVTDDAPPFAPVLCRIAHKHASLGIRPAQYTVVGRHLMKGVAEVLGDAVTEEVAAAWDEVYWLLACELIAAEARLYQQAGVDDEQPWRPWRVAGRHEESADTVSFLLTPEDGGPVPDFLPGQYVTVVVDLPDGSRQPRQYTLSQAPGRDTLRITVRRILGVGGAPDGAVSTYLCEQVCVGHRLLVSEPFGDVTLAPGGDPLLLVSAGVGITPMSAILDHVARTQADREVVAVHADRSPRTHPLRAEVEAAGSRLRSFRNLAWYEQVDVAADTVGSAREGFVDVDEIPVPAGVRVYLCGPLPFMRDVRAGLLRGGVPGERISYEVFGPDLWAGAPVDPRADGTPPTPS